MLPCKVLSPSSGGFRWLPDVRRKVAGKTWAKGLELEKIEQ
jgi:hypothetical protein